MGAGDYRAVIKIQKPGTTQNAYGEPVAGFVDVMGARAAFEPLYGRELFTAEQAGSHVECRFRMRHRDGIESKMRVVYRGVPYEILYPIDVGGKRKELLLYCKKVS